MTSTANLIFVEQSSETTSEDVNKDIDKVVKKRGRPRKYFNVEDSKKALYAQQKKYREKRKLKLELMKQSSVTVKESDNESVNVSPAIHRIEEQSSETVNNEDNNIQINFEEHLLQEIKELREQLNVIISYVRPEIETTEHINDKV